MNRISHLFDEPGDEAAMRQELARRLASRLLDVDRPVLLDLAASLTGITMPTGGKASAHDAATIFIDILDLGGDA